MNSLATKNADILDGLASKSPLTFPMAAYLDYANSKGLVITAELVRNIESQYFGRFDNEEEFIQAVQGDFGKHLYPTKEKIYEDFVCFNKRYFQVR